MEKSLSILDRLLKRAYPAVSRLLKQYQVEGEVNLQTLAEAVLTLPESFLQDLYEIFKKIEIMDASMGIVSKCRCASFQGFNQFFDDLRKAAADLMKSAEDKVNEVKDIFGNKTETKTESKTENSDSKKSFFDNKNLMYMAIGVVLTLVIVGLFRRN